MDASRILDTRRKSSGFVDDYENVRQSLRETTYHDVKLSEMYRSVGSAITVENSFQELILNDDH